MARSFRSLRRAVMLGAALACGVAAGAAAAAAGHPHGVAADGTAPSATAPGHGDAPWRRSKAAPARPAPLLDLNRASRVELRRLPGLTPGDVDRIVAHRPYRSKADLVADGVLAAGRFVQIRAFVVALPAAGGAAAPRPQGRR